MDGPFTIRLHHESFHNIELSLVLLELLPLTPSFKRSLIAPSFNRSWQELQDPLMNYSYQKLKFVGIGKELVP